MTTKKLHDDMKATYQFKTMNMLEHGEAVAEEYIQILAENGKRVRF